MWLFRLRFIASSVAALLADGRVTAAVNSTFINPVLPGWFPDPTCVFISELEDTTFCAFSSFLNFPGLPIYASRDLQNWRHIGNAFNRVEQVPLFDRLTNDASAGFWAPNIRYHDGTLFVTATFMIRDRDRQTSYNLIISTTDPFSDEWTDAIVIDRPRNFIDPDLFWDDNGKVYLSVSWGHINVTEIDLATGKIGQPVQVWGGTGGANPEASHIYKKDGYYYLLIAEGGSGPNHAVTVARANGSVTGPYESYELNPLLTNRDTNEYFQEVGHADLFQDKRGAWWGMALAVRGGPRSTTSPMGRESVLFPVTWDDGEWPIATKVQGRMSGWRFPDVNRSVEGRGDWASDGDELSFEPNSVLPLHFVHLHRPDESRYAISPRKNANTLRLLPSAANLTGSDDVSPSEGRTFLGRRQSATIFDFSVDVDFSPDQEGEESGITLFRTTGRHIDLSVIHGYRGRELKLSVTSFEVPNSQPFDTVYKKIPNQWRKCPIRLSIHGEDEETYMFSASSPCSKSDDSITFSGVGSDVVTGGFTGTLVGVYATSNGRDSDTPSYFSCWKYLPLRQQIDYEEFVDLR